MSKVKVVLNDQYFIEIDQYNHTLFKNIATKKGSRIAALGYYKDIKSGLSAAYKDMVETKETNILNMESYIRRINDITKEFEESLVSIENRIKPVIKKVGKKDNAQ